MDDNLKDKDYIEFERCAPLFRYVTLLRANKLDKITEEMKPRNEIEEEWVQSEIKFREKDEEKEKEDGELRIKAYAEAEKILRKYLPKEYWSDGYFNSDEFLELKEKVEERAYNEIDDIIESDKPLKKVFLLGPWRVYASQEIYVLNRTIEILKKEYKIDWKPLYNIAPKEYKEKIKELEKKYGGIHIPEY